MNHLFGAVAETDHMTWSRAYLESKTNKQKKTKKEKKKKKKKKVVILGLRPWTYFRVRNYPSNYDRADNG